MNNNRFAVPTIAVLGFIFILISATFAGQYAPDQRDEEIPGGFQLPEIELYKSVALEPVFCGLADTIEVPSGTQVTYCYELTNTGTITLTQHQLIDSELGLIIDDNYILEPGAMISLTVSISITSTTVNTATWTASNPGPTDTVTSTDTATVTIVSAALIDVDPLSLFTVQGPDQQITMPLEIGNVGDADLEWLTYEELINQRLQYPARKTEAEQATLNFGLSQHIVTSRNQCAEYGNYIGAEPAGYAEICLGRTRKDRTGISNSDNSNKSYPSLDPTDIAYAQDFSSDEFVWHYLNDFPGQIVVGQQSAGIFGYDFDVTGNILYGLNNDTKQLGTINLDNGAFTPIGASIPGDGETLTGLTIHPRTNAGYVSTSDSAVGRLYSIDLDSGWLTFIGGDTTVPLLIDIAINPESVMYGHDITEDSIYIIDTETGAATLVGPTGVNANFAQGMDFDNYDGNLYAWIYEGSGLNQYGIINLATGALTPLAVDNPQGEFEGATLTPLVDSCERSEEVNWLSVNPTSGSVGPGASQTISITVDSSNLTSGTHQGIVCIESNDFFERVIRVPVTLEVESVASIQLNKTVGLVEKECATTDFIKVQRGTLVFYCFEITNIGSVPFSRHDLVDSELGILMSNLSAPLLPGGSLRPIVSSVIFETTVNTATWTAYNPGPADLVSDTDTATVDLLFPFTTYSPFIIKP